MESRGGAGGPPRHGVPAASAHLRQSRCQVLRPLSFLLSLTLPALGANPPPHRLYAPAVARAPPRAPDPVGVAQALVRRGIPTTCHPRTSSAGPRRHLMRAAAAINPCELQPSSPRDPARSTPSSAFHVGFPSSGRNGASPHGGGYCLVFTAVSATNEGCRRHGRGLWEDGKRQKRRLARFCQTSADSSREI